MTGVETRPDPPRISVLIANFNYARFLATAIRSVLDQTYGNVECIVIDDGSTDNSLAIASSFADVVVISKPNGGQVSAAKFGIARATGNLIIFLDSDDSLYPDACAVVAAAYDPAVSLYQGRLDIVDADGNRMGEHPDAPFIHTDHQGAVLRHGFFPSSPTSGNAFSAAHVRRMLDEAGDDLRYFVDGYLIYSAPFFGTIKLLDATLGRYLVHGANVSLAAGVNRRSAEKSLRNAIWQRGGVVIALRLLGRPHGDTVDYLTAWHLRYLLILRRCYGVGDLAPEWSDARVAFGGMAKFLRYPGISLKQRLQNIALMGLLLAGVRTLGRRIVPPAS